MSPGVKPKRAHVDPGTGALWVEDVSRGLWSVGQLYRRTLKFIDTWDLRSTPSGSASQTIANHSAMKDADSSDSSTELSELIWRLKNSGTDYSVAWKVLQSSIPCKIGGSECDLCLSEKLHIIGASYPIINKRTELISKCRHKNKFSLRTVKL